MSIEPAEKVAVKIPESKVCALPGCDVVFERRKSEGPRRWTVRKFHDATCANLARRGPGNNGPKVQVPDGVPVAVSGPSRGMWRPSSFVLRPGDLGYEDEVAS